MQPLIDREEALWAACARLGDDPAVLRPLLSPGSDDDEPVLLAYGPVARRNQFQALLYSRSQEHGFHPLAIQRLNLFGCIPWAGPVVCHLHWVHELTAKAADEAAADAGVEEWERLLKSIKAAGHSIAWTVHNVLPHESRFPEHDRRVHQMVADAADVVHVMSAGSAALCAPHYRWNAGKEMLVPHPSYARAQTDWTTRDQARASLGIAGGEFVFLSFGAILPYKGYERLMRAFGQLSASSGRPLRWLVAGQPSSPDMVQALRSWAFGRHDVTLDVRPIPNEELQDYFRAADVAVCPYERTLNSGAALMATSFDLPVIGPRVGGFIDNLGESCAYLYEQGSDEGLLAAMRAAIDETPAARRARSEACAELSARLSPGAVSAPFFQGRRKQLHNIQGQPTAARRESVQ